MNSRTVTRQLVLPAVAAVHIAAAWLWLANPAAPPDSPYAGRTIFFELVAARQEPQRPAASRSAPAAPRRDLRRRKPLAPSINQVRPDWGGEMTEVASAAMDTSKASKIEPDPFALEAGAPISIGIQARKDAVQFDKQVNKDRLKGITSLDDLPFAKAIAGAYVSTATTINEYKSADGRPITKVTSRGRSYCVMALESNSIMAESMRRQGAGTRKVNCPK